MNVKVIKRTNLFFTQSAIRIFRYVPSSDVFSNDRKMRNIFITYCAMFLRLMNLNVTSNKEILYHTNCNKDIPSWSTMWILGMECNKHTQGYKVVDILKLVVKRRLEVKGWEITAAHFVLKTIFLVRPTRVTSIRIISQHTLQLFVLQFIFMVASTSLK